MRSFPRQHYIAIAISLVSITYCMHIAGLGDCIYLKATHYLHYFANESTIYTHLYS